MPGGRWYALGPVYLDQVMRAASRGGYAVAAWLAVHAQEGKANGEPATVKWIVKATGMSERDARRAVTALIELGMVKRDGRKISSLRKRADAASTTPIL